MKKGYILSLTSSEKACMVGLRNSETKSNHIGWSAMKTLSHGRQSYSRLASSLTKVSLDLN